MNFIKTIIKIFNLEKYCFFELYNFIKNFEKETCFIYESYNMKLFYEYYKNNE